MKKTVLLTGGLGYVGSVTAHVLHTLGYEVVIIDAMLHQQKSFPPWARVIKSDINNSLVLSTLFQEYIIDAVMHFAGSIEVGESVKHPDAFYRNNIINSLHLLDIMRQYGVKRIIFSSSCAVYGNPAYIPIDEAHPFVPTNPYGRTKCAIEFALQDYAQAYGLSYGILRYFNAAGALPECGLGECHVPETHVIPLMLRAVCEQKPFTIFGNNYSTPDGTCIRDYIHVYDIARAHVSVLSYLSNGGNSDAFNLGSGVGYSVMQLVTMVQKVCQMPLETRLAPKRPGDVAALVANPAKAFNVLAWTPERSDLETIIRDAWAWEQLRTKKLNSTVPTEHRIT